MSVYAVADFHGIYGLYEQIKEFIKPDDTVIFLGDAADRGPDGWRLIQDLMADPQFIYLKGNHEEMLADAMEEYLDSDGRETFAIQHLVSNGGEPTIISWMIDGAPRNMIKKLRELPFFYTYENQDGKIIVLSHSGTPPIKNRHTGDYHMIERLALWDRDHCWVPHWGEEDLDMILVHGHTPIPYFFEGENVDIEIEPGAFWYCEDHKVNLDNGSCASGYTCLFDLDTYDEHIFFEDIFTDK